MFRYDDGEERPTTIDEVTGEELSFEIVKESTGRSDDLCAVEVAAFGF